MRIELRKVEYSAQLSEETAAFSAEIWIDSCRAGHARNHGQGGPTLISPASLGQRLDDHGKTLPTETIAGEPPFVVQPDGEWIVGRLLTDWILRRDLRRDLRNRALYTRTDKPGLFRTSVLKPVQLEQVLGTPEVRQRWSVAVFLNQVPEDEALRLYREQGGG